MLSKQVVQPGPATRLRRLMDRVASGATVLIDGGTGTECERRGVPVLDGAWSGSGALSHPETLREVHRDYVAAGAQVIIANTFSTHRHALETAGVGADFEAYNRRAVELAVEARTEAGEGAAEEAGADDVVVAAGISNWTWTGPHPGLDELRRQSVEQAAVLAAAGAELLILEMMVDVERMRATLEGAATAGLPVWVGLTCGSGDGHPVAGAGSRLRDGEPLAEAVAALADHDVEVVAIMHTDVALVDECLDVVLPAWTGPVAVYAHSGAFVDNAWVFSRVISPDEYLHYAQGWSARGVRLVGGCCGTGPEHVRALTSLLQGVPRGEAPRRRRRRPPAVS